MHHAHTCREREVAAKEKEAKKVADAAAAGSFSKSNRISQIWTEGKPMQYSIACLVMGIDVNAALFH